MEKVESEEYPNVSQAVIGVLVKCKEDEEHASVVTTITKRLDELESENLALKKEIESIKAVQKEMDAISALVAKYQAE